MIKLENYEVMGWEHAIRGMRNPMNSWAKSDSFVCTDEVMTNEEIEETCGKCPHNGNCPILDHDPHFIVGKNDHALMRKLADAGPVHGKYRRMITVYVDITAPLYWWKEFDTYKVGTVANSCSTMHKIHDKEFGLCDFSTEHLLAVYDENGTPTDLILDVSTEQDGGECFSPCGILNNTVKMLNLCRNKYLKTKDKKYWWQMIQLLPSSYNQKRTVMLNYEVLANIYKYRKDHKLDEWREFCKWIESLPYSEIITGGKDE